MTTYDAKVREYDRRQKAIADAEQALNEANEAMSRFLESIAGVEAGDVIVDFKGEMKVTRVDASCMKPDRHNPGRFTNPGIYGVRRLAGSKDWGKREVNAWGSSWQLVETANG